VLRGSAANPLILVSAGLTSFWDFPIHLCFYFQSPLTLFLNVKRYKDIYRTPFVLRLLNRGTPIRASAPLSILCPCSALSNCTLANSFFFFQIPLAFFPQPPLSTLHQFTNYILDAVVFTPNPLNNLSPVPSWSGPKPQQCLVWKMDFPRIRRSPAIVYLTAFGIGRARLIFFPPAVPASELEIIDYTEHNPLRFITGDSMVEIPVFLRSCS